MFQMPTTPTGPSDAEPTETESAELTVRPTVPTDEPIESIDEQTVTTNISANNRPQSRPPKKKADSIVSDVLLSVQNHFKRPAIKEDRYDVFAKSVAIKMRELSKTQRLIAEKIINDTLFEAELGNLTFTHKLHNDNHTQQFTFDQQPQYSHSPLNWSSSSASSNHTYLSSSPIPPGPATNSTQPIVITQMQALEVEEQTRNSVQLSIPDANAATYLSNFQM